MQHALANNANIERHAASVVVRRLMSLHVCAPAAPRSSLAARRRGIPADPRPLRTTATPSSPEGMMASSPRQH